MLGHSIQVGSHESNIMFKGKTVAVVGNAASLFNRSYGEEINRHEVIARMNKAAILYTKPFDYRTHGQRTDAWFTWRVREYEHATMHQPVLFTMQMNHWEDAFPMIYPKEMFFNLKDVLKGAIPSTGLMTLDWIRSQNPHSISVYGFDWKETPTFTDMNRETDKKLSIDGPLHDFEAERKYVYDKFISDSIFNFRF